MPHRHRFFASPESGNPSLAILRDEEAHHAIHVVRLRPGERVEVIDGQGHSWNGEVQTVSRRDVTIQLTDENHVPRPAAQVTLIMGWLHRDKSLEEVIRRCTEIGLDRFVFFRAKRSERKPRLSDKWERLAIESCKQCGRRWLPTFDVADSLEQALSRADGPLLIATKDAAPQSLSSSLQDSHVTLLIGPEGDFSDDELKQALDVGAIPVSFGETTFRTEVAAIVGTSLVLYELGHLGPRAKH